MKNRIKIIFSKRWIYTAILLAFLAIAGIGIYAFGGNNPSSSGHSIQELSPPSSCGSNQFLQWEASGWTCAIKTQVNNTFSKVEVSNDGKYLFLSTYTKSYNSEDHGISWTFSQGGSPYGGISKDGKYQIKKNNDDNKVYVSSDYGRTWTAKVTTILIATAISSDGKYQIIGGQINIGGKTAVQVYTSSNFGNSWTARKNISNENGVAFSMSEDGKYQTEIQFQNKKVYVSSDYGQTWALKGTPNGKTGSLAMSADGKYQTIFLHGMGSSILPIYASSNYGQTWTAKGPAFNQGGKVAMSVDGKYQTATPSNNKVRVSSDYGNTWVEKGETGISTPIAMSDNGKYQTVYKYPGNIYISSDYGQTWTAKAESKHWVSIGMSGDGKYIFASANQDYLYKSSNYGQTWVPVLR